jgi:hypothetical protein
LNNAVLSNWAIRVQAVDENQTHAPVGSTHARTRSIIYLACPYTHADHDIRELRFNAATVAAAHLIEHGHIVYSPITMTHPIDTVLASDAATLGSDYWIKFDEAFMDVCSELIVLKIDGWDTSSGIRREIEYFREQGKPVSFLEASTLGAIPHTSRQE